MAVCLLKHCLKKLQPVLVSSSGNENAEFSGITNNSSDVQQGFLFCAIRGAKTDGHNYLPDAIRKGAAGCIISETSAWQPDDPSFPVIRVSDSYYAWSLICETFFDSPAHQMDVFAVTGTNGKTTSVFLMRKLFRTAFPQERCGMLSTVEYDTGTGNTAEAARTTPDALQIQSLFHTMKTNGCSRAVMELSSHGLHQHRTGSLRFAGAIFTNLTGDHLDYHGDMEHYFLAKRMLFQEMLAPDAPAVINLDDSWGRRLYDELKQQKRNVCGFTLQDQPHADAMITDLTLSASGSVFTLTYRNAVLHIRSVLIGAYNVSNLAGVALLALAKGVAPETVEQVLNQPDIAPPGRLEAIPLPNGIHAFVDYAHTDDALFRVLSALRAVSTSRIITVFGCGGDRDRTKRPRMAAVAEKLSDKIIVTSDNPRTEDPQKIIEEICTGFSSVCQYRTEPDRRKAIELAIRSACAGDILLVAGKGHENYQEICGVKYPFDDREIIQRAGECL